MASSRGLTELRELPELGVGFIFWPQLAELVDLAGQPVDVLEVEPQPFWFAPRSNDSPFELDRRAFDQLRQLPQPKLVHGVGFPLGGTVPQDRRQLGAFVESIGLLGAPWASEHLSFNRVHRGATDVDVGFLLPPIQSDAGVSVAAANITALRAGIPVPFAFETGVNYLRRLPGELSDGSFFAAVAEKADCGILLDLHNLWANALNGRQDVLRLVDELPLERVVEVHLAGGQDLDGYWVDAHSDLIAPALMELARLVVPRLPNLKAIIYEVMPEYVVANGISNSQLADQFWALQDLWAVRGRDAEGSPRALPRRNVMRIEAVPPPSPAAWETALSGAVTSNRPVDVGLEAALRLDPGARVLRKLISAVRAGKVADALTLTTRFLLLTVGEQRLQDLLDDFWDAVPSELMVSGEASRFVAYLTASPLGSEVPHLTEVANFELAANEAVMTREPQTVTFSADPQPLLAALRQGHMPETLQPGNFVVTVAPPA